MECSICGKKVKKLFLVKVEEATLEVCEGCAKKYGSLVEEKQIKNEKEHKTSKNELVFNDFDFVENFGEILKKRRNEMNLSIEEAAKRIGIKASTLSKIEREEILPDDKTVKKLEKFFNVKIRERTEEKESIKLSKELKLRIVDVVEFKE